MLSPPAAGLLPKLFLEQVGENLRRGIEKQNEENSKAVDREGEHFYVHLTRLVHVFKRIRTPVFRLGNSVVYEAASVGIVASRNRVDDVRYSCEAMVILFDCLAFPPPPPAKKKRDST